MRMEKKQKMAGKHDDCCQKDTEDFVDINQDFDMSLTVDKDDEDVAVLVESLTNYHTLDPHMRKEAFSALRSLLSNKKSTQDFFRELQGVELMISIYQEGKSQEDFEVMENALFTLGVAVERNDVSRNALLTPEFLTLIKQTMKRKSTSSLTSAFLLTCLVSNNGDGQALARKTKCIHKLCELLKEAIADSDDSEQTCKICNAICSTLCAVNIDPVNESNQELCCLLIMPSLVRWLYSDISRQSLHSMISLLGSCINGNRKTKTQLRLIGGLRVLVAVLDKSLSPEEFQSNDSIYFLIQLINTLSCSYHYHEVNQVHAVELGAVELLLTCLVNAVRHAQLQKTCVTALVSLLDSDDNKQGKQKFLDHRGVQVLIEVMASSQDENLKKLVTYLLHKTCKPTLAREQSLDSRNTILRKTGKDSISSVLNFTKKKDVSVQKNRLHQDEKQRSKACHCKSTIIASSRTVLAVLLKHPAVCEYHNCIGQTLQAYITRKQQLLAASVE